MHFHNEERVDQWAGKYIPVQNKINPYSSWNGTLFETYGAEHQRVLEVRKRDGDEYIWTWVDTDEGTAIVAGYHYVNRIGYFITENPWTTYDEYVEVTKDDDDETYEGYTHPLEFID